MENYQALYNKLFNALTDLTADTKQLACRMEAVQQECEELFLAGGAAGAPGPDAAGE